MKIHLTKKQTFSIAAILVIGSLLGILILGTDKSTPQADGHGHGAHAEAKGHGDVEHHGGKADDKHEHAKGHADEEHHEDAAAQGPHGGKLFKEGEFGLEILLAEEGGEPRFRTYLFNKGQPLPSNAAKVTVTLARPNGETQEIAFAPEEDYLKSTTVVAEPHIFEATVTAQVGNEPYLFAFVEEEGKIALNEAQIKAAGVTLQQAGPAQVQNTLILPGQIQFNQDRTAHVVPRLGGTVESVTASLGQQVKKGQVLAVIASTGISEQRSELLTAQKRLSLAKTTYAREKKLWQEKISAEQDYLQAEQALREAEIAVQNASQKLSALGAVASGSGPLNRYELRAPFDGMVVEKHIALGEAVKEDDKVFTISDLSIVWAEFAVPPKDLNLVRVGEKALVKATAFDSQAPGTITYVGALLGEQTRTANARVTLSNPQMAWRPGLAVNVEIISGESQVPVAISADALQSVDGQTVVFVRVPGGFIAQPVMVGKMNDKLVEITKGLQAGTQYVAAGSFVIKSELGKASATHSH